MKNNLVKVFLCLVCLSAIVIACDDSSSEENEPIISNYIKVGDKEYDLYSGAIENYGQYVKDGGVSEEPYSGYCIDLTFHSKGLSLSEYEDDTESYLIYKGTGFSINFIMYSSTSDYLKDGTYVFDASSPYSEGTFREGVYYLNWSDQINDELEDQESVLLKSGTITIDIDGGDYEFKIDCVDESGLSVKGSFKGVLPYFHR